MKNFLKNCFHSGRSGQACPMSEGLGVTGGEMALGGTIVAVAGVSCWILGSWVRGRHDAAAATAPGKKAE